ncbi:hypothetical protein J6P52_04105 [bacterium]|nr:hypothetical protein [bacterium]
MFLYNTNQKIKSFNINIPEMTLEDLSRILKDTDIISLNSGDDNNIKDINNPNVSILPFRIIIGGNLLDRGLTINGLAVVYITRDSKIA